MAVHCLRRACDLTDCWKCAKTKPANENWSLLQIFIGNGSLKLVAVDIRGPLQKTLNGNEVIPVMINCYTKLTRAVPTFNKTALHIASHFIGNLTLPYVIAMQLLRNDNTQLVIMFFVTLTTILGPKHLTTTAYNWQTKGQSGRTNNTIIARLQHCVAKHPQAKDIYVQPIAYIRVAPKGIALLIWRFSGCFYSKILQVQQQSMGWQHYRLTQQQLYLCRPHKWHLLLHRLYAMRQNADKRMKPAHQRYKFTTKGFALFALSYSCCPLDGMCTSIAHKWQNLLQSSWKQNRRVDIYPRKFVYADSTKFRHLH